MIVDEHHGKCLSYDVLLYQLITTKVNKKNLWQATFDSLNRGNATCRQEKSYIVFSGFL